MKKSLVAAMALAIGITASASAANPFSDVPAGHWAYESIAKLAAAGVVEGYPDSTFRGDKLMTRYEMAQIVAKAMAKGANVDRLASEFAEELDALGLRVAKLEKKSDNVRITGNFRYHYSDYTYSGKAKTFNGGEKYEQQVLRTRLYIMGKVNDNWTYVSMFQAVHSLMENKNHVYDTITSGEGVNFQQAYLDGRLGGVKIQAGRYNFTTAEGGNIYDSRMDGLGVSYGKNLRLSGYYGRPTDEFGGPVYDKFWGVNLEGDSGKLTLGTGYTKFYQAVKVADGDDAGWAADDSIFSVNAKYNFGDAALGLVYLHSNLESANYKDAAKDGYVVNVSYKGAKDSKPGSWGLGAWYYFLGNGNSVAHTMDGYPACFTRDGQGFKGYQLAATYTFAKNIRTTLEYFDLRGREDSDSREKVLWGQLKFSF
jgi:hypothetical protein